MNETNRKSAPSLKLLDFRLYRGAAWMVHLFTASGAIFGLLALHYIHTQDFIAAFWMMGIAVIIDSIDGFFARMVKVKNVLPEINGELLDNIVDYINYVTVPAFFLLEGAMLPEQFGVLGAALILLASAYQFTQRDAKTADHFFKGFPSYWNIVIFYLFFWQTSPVTNLGLIVLFCILSFVPVKYVYPSRLDYLCQNISFRRVVVLSTWVWGAATLGLLWLYPGTSQTLVLLSIGYIVFYILLSLYRTIIPFEDAEAEFLGESS